MALRNVVTELMFSLCLRQVTGTGEVGLWFRPTPALQMANPVPYPEAGERFTSLLHGYLPRNRQACGRYDNNERPAQWRVGNDISRSD